jgi:serine/threonine-protein kinase
VLAGRYRLLRRRAAGGMAQVWVAEDTVLGRPVAAKVLHAHLAADDRFLRRFRAEAIAAARLAHPNIVAIYDTVSEPPVEAIIMELIDGITLREYLDRFGAVGLTDTLDVVDGIASALDAAHRGGVVHRDVKPANILLCPDRRVKVTDFGIAKASEDSDLTQQGTLLGTAKYLAPEQLEGRPVDARTDVYALGTVTYECLCGRTPFDEGSDTATALARLHREPPSLRTFLADIPDGVDLAVRRALARHPDLRPPSASAFVELLRAGTTGAVVAYPPQASSPSVAASTAWPTVGPPTAPTVVLTPAPAPTVEPDEVVPAAGVRQLREDTLASPRWVTPVIVTLIVAACIGLGLALVLDRNGTDDTGGSAASGERPADGSEPGGTAVTVLEAFDFDPLPLGDAAEHPEAVERAFDGNTTTSWFTETYSTPAFGNLKPGVGVVAVADQDVSQVVLRTPTPGWVGEVYVADEPADALEGWGGPVGTITATTGAVDDTVVIGLGRSGRAVLIWITDLGGSSVEIAEISLLA